MRVAIVGGGCAGLSAAWQLSRCPEYEVHVFERSFRLGGKGASGRDAHGRIHEHGLHVWLGFYENAFRLMRQCYAEVGRQGWGPAHVRPEGRLAHASIDEAFFPEPHVGVAGIGSRADFKVWSGMLPPAPGLPGEPLDAESNPYTLASYLLRCLDLIRAVIQSTVADPAAARELPRASLDAPGIEQKIERLARYVSGGALTGVAALLQAVTLIEGWIRDAGRPRGRDRQVLRMMTAVAAQSRKLLDDLVRIDETLRWKTEIVDIVLAIAVGLVRDKVLFRREGFDAINGLDYRAWLARHGATRAALESRFITGIYELVFAYEDGDHRRPALAAGVALRGALRMFFTYRGAMFWRLRSGMGDAVFAPLYKAMIDPAPGADGRRARSAVRFHFHHALKGVSFAEGRDARPYVSRLDFETRGDPLRISAVKPVALDAFGCWPTDERVLLPDGDATRAEKSLVVGRDFDAVVLATGIDDFVAAMRGAARPDRALRKLPPKWAKMAETTRTVATQAAQVWLDADVESLGWQGGPGIVTALDMPFDTWADMTHTLATERAWRRAVGAAEDAEVELARSVAYFCSALAQRDIDPAKLEREGREAEDVVAASLEALLKDHARRIWPRAFDGGLTAIDRLVGVRKAKAGTRVGVREDEAGVDLVPLVRANVSGSERYTLSLPGSIAHRISPLDDSVANMTIAGDWTACGLDCGCVEAAVISGMLAAHAITGGVPALESIVGYDHP